MSEPQVAPFLDVATKPITIKTRVPSEDLPSFYHETGRIFVLDGLTWEGMTQEMTLRFVPPPTMEEKWNDPKKGLPGVGVTVRWKMRNYGGSPPWHTKGHIDDMGGIVHSSGCGRSNIGVALGWLPS